MFAGDGICSGSGERRACPLHRHRRVCLNCQVKADATVTVKRARAGRLAVGGGREARKRRLLGTFGGAERLESNECQNNEDAAAETEDAWEVCSEERGTADVRASVGAPATWRWTEAES